jgi:cysteine-rich repeat protein
VGPGQDVVIEGDTTGAKDDFKGKAGACAAGAGGPDHVYHLIPTGSGALNIKVQAMGGFNPTIYLRTTCEDEASQVACGETTGAGGAEQINTNVVTGRDYFLVVDGASGTAGKYTITAKLTSGSFCGDGKVDANEACDDGNKTEGDGCSNDCRKVNGDPTSGGSCPGHPVHVWTGQTVTGTGSNMPYGNTFNKPDTTCSTSGGTNIGQEHIYAVTPHATGTLRVQVTSDPGVNHMIFARRTCTDAASQGAGMCANNQGSSSGSTTETMSFSVTKDQMVYVAVDGGGVAASKGNYSISFVIQ